MLLLLNDHWDWWEIQGLAAELSESGIEDLWPKGARFVKVGWRMWFNK